MVMPCSRSASSPSTSSAKSMLVAGRAVFAESRLERGRAGRRRSARRREQPADQRRLAVVDRAAGEEAQQARAAAPMRGASRRRRPSEISLALLLLHRRRLRRCRSAGPAAPRCAARSISAMMSSTVVGVGLDRAGQRIAAERAEAHLSASRLLARLSGKRSSSTMISVPSRSTTGRWLGEIERHDRDVLGVDVVPDVELGPVRQREHPHRSRRAMRVL